MAKEDKKEGDLSEKDINDVLGGDFSEETVSSEKDSDAGRSDKFVSPADGARIRKVEFTPADDEVSEGYETLRLSGAAEQNIKLLMDVPMEVTVELGRATRTVEEILSMGEGSIIELDKIAGEAVDLLVNGKAIARGEVVVIDENFGLRVTQIVSPKKRVPFE